MEDCITTDARTTFDPEALRAIVSGGDFEHSQMTDGPFRGHLMRSHIGGSILDMGTYSQDLVVRGSFPNDRITLGFILSGREAGYFNGMRDHLLHAAAEGEPIAAIAARFGLRHPGRFSQIYRSLFRELRSRTLTGRDA